jgi:hypothetical protein
MDGDNKKDLLVSGRNPPESGDAYIYCYRNTGTNQSPVLGASTKLADIQGDPIRGKEFICFTVSDINCDGCVDLVYIDSVTNETYKKMIFRFGKKTTSVIGVHASDNNFLSGGMSLHNGTLYIPTRDIRSALLVQLYSLNGQMVIRKRFDNPQKSDLKIPMGRYPAGNYIAQCSVNGKPLFARTVALMKQ